jgi:hypothetical protein
MAPRFLYLYATLGVGTVPTCDFFVNFLDAVSDSFDVDVEYDVAP